MKRLVAFSVGFLAGAVTLLCPTYAQKNESPLMASYRPTRLEWLALDLESRYKSQLQVRILQASISRRLLQTRS